MPYLCHSIASRMLVASSFDQQCVIAFNFNPLKPLSQAKRSHSKRALASVWNTDSPSLLAYPIIQLEFASLSTPPMVEIPESKSVAPLNPSFFRAPPLVNYTRTHCTPTINSTQMSEASSPRHTQHDQISIANTRILKDKKHHEPSKGTTR